MIQSKSSSIKEYIRHVRGLLEDTVESQQQILNYTQFSKHWTYQRCLSKIMPCFGCWWILESGLAKTITTRNKDPSIRLDAFTFFYIYIVFQNSFPEDLSKAKTWEGRKKKKKRALWELTDHISNYGWYRDWNLLLRIDCMVDIVSGT